MISVDKEHQLYFFAKAGVSKVPQPKDTAFSIAYYYPNGGSFQHLVESIAIEVAILLALNNKNSLDFCEPYKESKLLFGCFIRGAPLPKLFKVCHKISLINAGNHVHGIFIELIFKYERRVCHCANKCTGV